MDIEFKGIQLYVDYDSWPETESHRAGFEITEVHLPDGTENGLDYFSEKARDELYEAVEEAILADAKESRRDRDIERGLNHQEYLNSRRHME